MSFARTNGSEIVRTPGRRPPRRSGCAPSAPSGAPARPPRSARGRARRRGSAAALGRFVRPHGARCRVPPEIAAQDGRQLAGPADDERPRVVRSRPQLLRETAYQPEGDRKRHQRRRPGRAERPRAYTARQHPHRGEVRDHRRPADADERKWNAGDRRDPHRHADVDEQLEQERDHDAAGDHRGVEVARDRDNAQASPEHEQIEREQQRGADEAALLAERREDEVGVVLRQEVEPRLRPAEYAASLHLARADGGDRLLEVVAAGCRGARRRMREAGQALLLVALEEVDADRRPRPQHADGEQQPDQPDRAELLPRRPGDEQHRSERGEVDESRAEVRLGEHEHDRQQAEPDHAQRRPDLVQPPRPLGDEAREREDEERASRTPTAGT